jgi:hypothetical protein
VTRLIATFWLSLLLVGMQHQLVVHEIGHLGARLDRGSDVSVHKADFGSCIECSLLAGGSNAVPLDGVAHTITFQPAASPVGPAGSAPPQGWRVHYLSRAPPTSWI